MQFTTLVTGLSALILSNTVAAAAVRSGHSHACKNSPHSEFALLSHWPAAQAFCSSASHAAISTVTATVTTTPVADLPGTASTSIVETITVTETSTAVATDTPLPKARRGKCRKPSVTSESPALQSSESASYDALYSRLASSPSSVAESVCSCYVDAPVTVTVTSTTTVPSDVAIAAAQSTGVVTITTTIVVSDVSSGIYETISNTSTTGTSTSEPVSASSTSASTEAEASTSTLSATSSCSAVGSTYTTDNGLVFGVTCSSLYLANETNTISQSELPDLETCIDACAETSGCAYLLFVESEAYGAARQCYLLNSDIGFGTDYDGIATAKLIAG